MKARTSRGLRTGLCAALVACSTLLGCAAPAAFSDWERGADLGPGKTFAVTQSAQLPEQLDQHQQALVALVNSAIERELTQKGYTKAPVESAQLVVNFYVLRRMVEEVSVKSRECYMSNRGELPPGTNWDSAAIACEESLVSEYQEGTLIIDIYDAAKKELVWHGWKSRKSLPSDSPELPAVVEQATVDILSNFPPG